MRSLKNDTTAFIDISVGISIGIVFAALMIIAYVIFTLKAQLLAGSKIAGGTPLMNNSLNNITQGFDQTVKESSCFGIPFDVNSDHSYYGGGIGNRKNKGLLYESIRLFVPKFVIPHDVARSAVI
jgi:hypothetical protein